MPTEKTSHPGVHPGDAQKRRDDAARRNEAEFLEIMLKWIETLGGKNPPTRKPPVVPLLTFADTVRYFTEEHPGDAGIRAGALLRQPHPQGCQIFQIFLGDDDEVYVDNKGRPYGRTVVATEIDQELATKFNDHDLVIFR